MRVAEVTREYNVGDVFHDFFCSDMHMDAPDHDRELLIRELDSALKIGANIYIGGDQVSALLPKDFKRFNNSSSTMEGDDILNQIIYNAVDVLTPYAKNIKVILCGNHEESVIKFHNIDLNSLIIYELNKLEGVNIEYLGYQGFVNFKFKYSKGEHTFRKVLYGSHGTGGNSPVTKGAIKLFRMNEAYIADYYWQGHSHSKIVQPCNNALQLDRNGKLVNVERKSFITGAYIKPAIQESTTTRGGRPRSMNVDYGNKFIGTVSTGGITLRTEILTRAEHEVKIIC